MPEPFIGLLAFVLGIWLWDHYFGKPGGYAPGTEEIALVKIDRDLRLADAMAADPPWLRGLAGVEDPVTARSNALQAFQTLATEKALSLQGLQAFAIVTAEHHHLPPGEVLNDMIHARIIWDFPEISEQLARHRGTWWHAKWIAAAEATTQPACPWKPTFEHDSQQLRTRAILARTAVWLIGMVGLGFLPGACLVLKRGLNAKRRGYGGAWPLPLGLVVFLVATLAWIGFTMTLELGLGTLPELHPILGILLDSAARMLPSLIALALLFRRPSHAIRVLGPNQPIATKTILGLFSLLLIIDQGLRCALGAGEATEPGGGLSAGEAGLWGLAFTITSACLLAPLAEELLYRGVLFRAFWNRLAVFPAALLSAAIFAVLHFYNGYGLASVAIFGLSCALLYAATGSLSSSIALHILYNSTIKIPEWLIYHGPLG